jgi:hypothetical protein
MRQLFAGRIYFWISAVMSLLKLSLILSKWNYEQLVICIFQPLVRVTCISILSYWQVFGLSWLINQFMHLPAFFKLPLNFHRMLQDMHLNAVVHELEEIFILHEYEIPFTMWHTALGWKRLSMPNNKRGKTSGDNVWIMFRYRAKFQNLTFCDTRNKFGR